MAEKQQKKIVNPPPIIVEVEDLNGQAHVLKAKTVTTENTDEFIQLVAKTPIGESIVAQAMWIFGGDKEFYRNFDLRVIKAAITSFSEQMQNPT